MNQHKNLFINTGSIKRKNITQGEGERDQVMKNSKIFKKIAATVISFLLVFSFLPTNIVFALNGPQNNPIDNMGYRVMNPTTLCIWFDKPVGSSINGNDQFKLFEGTSSSTGAPMQISVSNTVSGKNTAYSGASNGGGVTITVSDPSNTSFVPGHTYTLMVSGALAANNGHNLWNFSGNQNFEFNFTVPDFTLAADGSAAPSGTLNCQENYTSSSSIQPLISSWLTSPGGNVNVPLERTIWFSFSMPIAKIGDTTLLTSPNGPNNTADQTIGDNPGHNLNVIAQAVKVYKYADSSWKEITYNPLTSGGINTQKSGSTSIQDTNELGSPVISDDNTCISIPNTAGGSAISYNYDMNTEYKVTLPQLTFINGTTMDAQEFTFTTAPALPPTDMTNVHPTVAADSSMPGKLTVSWLTQVASPSLTFTQIGSTAYTYISAQFAPTGYNIYYSEDMYWDYKLLNTEGPVLPASGTTSYSFDQSEKGLDPNTTYYLRVSAVNNANPADQLAGSTAPAALSSGWNEGGMSAPVETTAPAWTNATLSASNITEAGLTLTWTAATDGNQVSSYKIYEGNSEIATVGGTVLSYNVTGLSADTSYDFKVEAGNLSGNWSSDGPSVTAKTTDAAAPTWTNAALSVSNITETGLTLTWTAANDNINVANYKIYEGNELIGTVAGDVLSYNVTGLNACTSYTFKVEAGDPSENWSSDGPAATAKTIPAEVTTGEPIPSGMPLKSAAVTSGVESTIKSSDGTSVKLPAGSLGSDVTVTISEDAQSVKPANQNVVELDPQYTERSFGPSGTTFNEPVTITIPFDGVSVNQADISRLSVFTWQNNQWQKIGGVVDTVNKTISVTVKHFSTYRVMIDRTPVETRISGNDRYETAVNIARSYFSTGAQTVILARGDISADALVAAPLAKYYNAPLLLTGKDKLPDSVLNEIKSLGAKKVIIVGGEGAVSSSIANVLTGLKIDVQRVYGKDRYETAYKVALQLGRTGEAVIVNGSDKAYADALSISSWSAYNCVPILYANASSTLPASTKQALTDLKITSTLIIGGTGVISFELEKSLPNAKRYGGSNRYETNAQILTQLQTSPQSVFVATGSNFADALAGSAAAAQTNAWVVLTGTSMTSSQKQMLTNSKGSILGYHILGGTAAVSNSVANDLSNILAK